MSRAKWPEKLATMVDFETKQWFLSLAKEQNKRLSDVLRDAVFEYKERHNGVKPDGIWRRWKAKQDGE